MGWKLRTRAALHLTRSWHMKQISPLTLAPWAMHLQHWIPAHMFKLCCACCCPWAGPVLQPFAFTSGCREQCQLLPFFQTDLNLQHLFLPAINCSLKSPTNLAAGVDTSYCTTRQLILDHACSCYHTAACKVSLTT